MVARKRGRDEMETEAPIEEPTTLQKLRNMWQFANLAQYIFLFKGALKIDEDFGIEELETECLLPQPSAQLAAIGLALLKHVSSHKGLTPEIFDEYTRRQFVAKAPARNPFGTEEIPNKFDDFDIFTKIRVLQQLSVWTLNNPNTIRERLNPTESEQIEWRFNPFGYDSKGRTLFVLDDMRMYRRTDPPPPPPPKAKTKAKARKSRSSRGSKRRKTSTPEPEEPEEVDEATELPLDAEPEDDGFGGMKWECVCITYEDYQDFLTGIRKSRHPDEKQLYKDIEADIIPELAKVAEAQARKEAKKMRELETLQKLATAKRSSRISAKMDKQREVEEAEEAARKRREEIAMAKAEQDRQRNMEDAHESRRQTREQRIREREAQKILQEENVRKLEEDEKKLTSEEARLSERHLTAQMKKAKRDLEKLKEKEYWLFDCEKCGLNGECLDDGKPQIQCDEKDGCGVWQHSTCHGISAKRANMEDFKFLCASCTRKQQAAKEPKLALKLRLTSASPDARRTSQANGNAQTEPAHQLKAVDVPRPMPQSPQRPVQPSHSLMNGPSLSPRGQALGPPGIQRSEAAYGSPVVPAGSSSPTRPRHPSIQGGVNMPNGLGSSPPRFPPHAISSFSNGTPVSRQNGSPFNNTNPFQSNFHPTYTSSFSRPTSAAGTTSFGSPIKHSSPRPTNGVPNGYNFTNSPHSSFPPSNAQASAMSPTKHSSPPPPLPQMMSSPAPAPVSFIAPSPGQMPAQILPDPIPAPSKHDGARPPSSHEMSEAHVFPPIKSLSPSVPPQNLSPPVKKSSPAPNRTLDVPMNGNPFDSSI
ncbi:uncharacterized protein N0V89_005112 [Didymosphaeria variabile]|uniref:Zinc finger PHD-type domain-containing protein n=1 Tax=Didymosphaeria variabile TaxID=1932322 RepID=A0A9W8XLK7_9PLEO|nr:uncharacterized protein N0V89_005112 [Didymosphaeria variabile]KAJ4353383.1 hypothetical protein N0V89_005112 [Didymosphaeria variabile]